ncbi:MAG: FmdE family protein [Actinomycetota bacterium]|nr:FmdE family protein [Actinomycetota bacterium]
MIDQQTLERVVDFHGHMCPGLAMGIRASEVALEQIGPHSQDEEVVAIVETDMCGVDAVQFLTGCTFGKGNLVHRDHGKNAYTFVRRSDGRAVRVSSRPGGWAGKDPAWDELFSRVRSGTASPEERARFSTVQQERSQMVLSAPLEALYDVRPVAVEPPRPARIHISIDCASCGEPTMETRVRRLDGRELCPPCFDAAMAGSESVAPPSLRSTRPTPVQG